MLFLYDGALDINKIQAKIYDEFKFKNCGALVSFVGIVRDEDGIDGLSFDINESMLKAWFDAWQERLQEKNSHFVMAHSKNDVFCHESSFFCAIISPKRKIALEMIENIVEDFKANAPIWKYDLRGDKRIFAKERSKKLPNAGLLK